MRLPSFGAHVLTSSQSVGLLGSRVALTHGFPINYVKERFDVNSFSRGMPSNRLRSNQPLRPEAPNQASPSSSSTPNYPATSHGGYAPRSNDFGGNFSPMHQTTPSQNPSAAPNSQVDFQAGSNRSMVVTANNAIPPNASNSASRIQNHVSEVDIPPSVLTGTGSYAPGSVQPLRSDK